MQTNTGLMAMRRIIARVIVSADNRHSMSLSNKCITVKIALWDSASPLHQILVKTTRIMQNKYQVNLNLISWKILFSKFLSL